MKERQFILNFTPTGMIPTKEMTPHVPVLPAEIVDQVTEAAGLGVTMVHLHARDVDTGKPTYKKDIYREIVSEIKRTHPDLILCLSTSGQDPHTSRAISTIHLRCNRLGRRRRCTPLRDRSTKRDPGPVLRPGCSRSNFTFKGVSTARRAQRWRTHRQDERPISKSHPQDPA